MKPDSITRWIYILAVIYWVFTWFPKEGPGSIFQVLSSYIFLLSCGLLLVHALRYSYIIRWILISGFTLALLGISYVTFISSNDPFLPDYYFRILFYHNHGVNTALVLLAIVLYRKSTPPLYPRASTKTLFHAYGMVVVRLLLTFVILSEILFIYTVSKINFWSWFLLPVLFLIWMEAKSNSPAKKWTFILLLVACFLPLILPLIITSYGEQSVDDYNTTSIFGILSSGIVGLGILITSWFSSTLFYISIRDLHHYLTLGIPKRLQQIED